MTEKPTACRMCTKGLTQPRTGRPSLYCSTGCRRAAENERARASRHLERLEGLLIRKRLLWDSARSADEEQRIEHEIARLTDRMIHLGGDD